MRVIKLKGMKKINGLHYAPDGRLLAVGGYEVRSVDDAVWVDVGAGKETSRISLMADCYAVSPELSKMALGGINGLEASVVWFDPTANDPLRPVPLTDAPGTQEIFGLAFDATGKRLAVSYSHDEGDGSGWNGIVIAPTGKGRRIENTGWERNCPILAFSPDGKRLAGSGGIDGSPAVFFFNARTLDYVGEYLPKGTRTRQLVFSPSGDELAVVNARNVYLLPADSSEPRLTLGGHPKQVNAVAFSPDGRRLVSACHDKLVRVWDVRTGELLFSYDWKIGAVTALAFAPDGLTAAAGGEKGQIVVWDWE